MVPAFDPKIEKVFFLKLKDCYLITISCFKNGSPPSSVEPIPVDGIWWYIILGDGFKHIFILTWENDPKLTTNIFSLDF